MSDKRFKFLDDNGTLVETDASTEMAARRKIRRLDLKLKRSGIPHRRRGRLRRVKGALWYHWLPKDLECPGHDDLYQSTGCEGAIRA